MQNLVSGPPFNWTILPASLREVDKCSTSFTQTNAAPEQNPGNKIIFFYINVIYGRRLQPVMLLVSLSILATCFFSCFFYFNQTCFILDLLLIDVDCS